MKELNITTGNTAINGWFYQPADSENNSPLVILSHGFGGSYRDLSYYAELFAQHGIAAYTFNFIGGGGDGSMTNMSVLTEAENLNAVFDYFQKDASINPKHIYLMGASQGGFVSTYVASQRTDSVAGLVLLYPAFVLQDDSRSRNPDPRNGPDTSRIMGMTIGRIYDEDAQSFDIYDEMKNYDGKVLIIHGTEDSIVPISYSKRAVRTFPDAELIKISGANHGFYGADEKSSAHDSLTFIQKLIRSE